MIQPNGPGGSARPLFPTDHHARARGPRLNAFMRIIRGCQDIIGLFIFGVAILPTYAWPLKYLGLGEILIFVNWGMVLIPGIYTILLGEVPGNLPTIVMAGMAYGLKKRPVQAEVEQMAQLSRLELRRLVGQQALELAGLKKASTWRGGATASGGMS